MEEPDAGVAVTQSAIEPEMSLAYISEPGSAGVSGEAVMVLSAPIMILANDQRIVKNQYVGYDN
jgi:hypothetical protein